MRPRKEAGERANGMRSDPVASRPMKQLAYRRLRSRHKAARRQLLGPSRCYVPRDNVDEDLTGIKSRSLESS
jgi:hypothetical protein